MGPWEGVGDVRLEAVSGGQCGPGNPEALPALSRARRPHAKMEHSRLPPSHAAGTELGNRERLSGKCTQLGCADGSSNGDVLMPTPSRSRPQRWDRSHIPISQMKHLRLRGNRFARAIQLLSGRAGLQARHLHTWFSYFVIPAAPLDR